MKKTEKKEPIKTIPKGVWESTTPYKQSEKKEITTDLQENGYPNNKKS